MAFFGNQLTSVTVGNNVTRIYGDAFEGNPLTSIRIGANVILGGEGLFGYATSFNNSFDAFYTKNGKKAGVYTSSNGKRWSYSPR